MERLDMKKLLISALMLLSFSATADTYREFQIKDDIWAIKTDTKFLQIKFCKVSGGNCLAAGIGILWDWDDYTSKGYTAEEFYREFLDKAAEKLAEYYGDDVTPPDPNDFVAYLEYLINHGTKYDESSGDFNITK